MTVNADPHSLHPCVRMQFLRLSQALEAGYNDGACSHRLLPFEAYRSPERQRELFASGRGVTKVGPWYSPHQFGLAVDFVPVIDGKLGKWTWDAPDAVWDYLASQARKAGLSAPYLWDRPHVEDSERWKRVRSAFT